MWSGTFEPLPAFDLLRAYGRRGRGESRHDQPYRVSGSDASGVIVGLGAGVRHRKVGDHVNVSPIQVDDQEAATHGDGMLGEGQRAWGYETNFGGLAHHAVVRASQLVAKPAHLTWEDSASTTACAGVTGDHPRARREKEGKFPVYGIIKLICGLRDSPG